MIMASPGANNENGVVTKETEVLRTRGRSGAFVDDNRHSIVNCLKCEETQKALEESKEKNETLVKQLSHIVSQLDQARQVIKSLEELCRQRENTPDHIHVPSQDISIIDPEVIAAKRKEDKAYSPTVLVEGMYPKGIDFSDMEEKLAQLDECLRATRETSINSVEYCFTNMTVRPPLKRMNTLHTSSFTSSFDHSLPPAYRPPLPHNHSEHHRPSSDAVSTIRRTLSETELHLHPSSGVMMLMNTSTDPLNEAAQMSCRLTDDLIPFRSRFMSALKKSDQVMSYASLSSTITQKEDNFAFASPLGQGLTGDESYQLLEKISILEDERLSLLAKVEDVNEQNKLLWQTINEMGQDLDCKHLQLQLLSTDIKQSTTQLRLAAEMRDELKDLKNERDKFKDKSSSLEDEGRLVKESLVQRLTEMAATNKVLSLDNQRLRTKILQLKTSSAPVASSNSFEDNLSETHTKVQETIDDDIRLQGALLELDDGTKYVHKQGFLTKQGHKVKTWRRRMFVLDTHSLSYYKTEQPLGIVPLEDILKVQITQGATSRPNMFEILRQETTNKRTYYLSAQSQEEMQSWVGIIQTLKHIKEQSKRASDTPTQNTRQLQVAQQQQQERNSMLVNNDYIKERSKTAFSSNGSFSTTMPRMDIETSRATVTEKRMSGVRNRMFTETGQRRTDLVISIETSDEEDMERDMRSPFSTVSSDDDPLKQERVPLVTLGSKDSPRNSPKK